MYSFSLQFTALIASEKRNGQLFFKPMPDVRSLIELSYYSNSLVAHFALDSVVICTLHKLLQRHEQNYPNSVSQLDNDFCVFFLYSNNDYSH